MADVAPEYQIDFADQSTRFIHGPLQGQDSGCLKMEA
jgi:hypothetical protein